MKFLITSALIATLAIPAAAVAADTHQPTLRGEITVGTTFRTRVERSHALLENRANLTTFQGQTTLTAIVKVTAVNDGQISSAELTIEDFADAPMQGQPRTLAAGTKLTVQLKGKRVKVSDPAGKLKREDLSPLERSNVLASALAGPSRWISGPTKPVTDGETWTLDGAAIGKEMGGGMEKTTIEAKAWLDDVSDHSYTVIGELKANGLNTSNPKIKGIKTTDGKVSGQITVTVSRAGKGPAIEVVDRRSVWMIMNVVRDGKNVATPTVMNTTLFVRNALL